MTKILKIAGIIFLGLTVLASVAYFSFVWITKDAVLDPNKFISTEQYISVFDDSENEITEASLSNKGKSVDIQKLNRHTINAFIASEDRTFFSHKGLNYKRILKAIYKNTLARSFKEGASTISQQLIKNTHLSGDKTISRKLKEIKLTRELEKKYTKEQILETYLNTIYFGHSCYGLQSAAQFYFDKRAEELTLDESAVLVGLLISPNNYSPFKHPEKSINRRNTVLKAMLDCGYITKTDYQKAKNASLSATRGTSASSKNADYLNAVFDELDEIDTDFYGISEGCKIYTYLNENLQNFIENIEFPCDNCVIVTSNSGGVNAYKSTIGNVKRQPGSTIKPLAVYAPSIEENLLYPFTKILDDKIDYEGYCPTNSDNKFHGYVTVAESIKMSYNVPAVKTLNSLTLAKAEKYLNAINIDLESGEKNLSLALGGMERGLTIKQLVDGYSTFASGGKFSPSYFIKRIEDKNGKIIYCAKPLKMGVFAESTASLINEMLLETSKSGTAKKMRDLQFDVASKTGTCGNQTGNTDAYSINYTSEHCIGVWLGDRDYKRLEVTGGNHCCVISKRILENLYTSKLPPPLDIESGTKSVFIDAEEYYQDNKIIIADSLSPALNNLKVKVPVNCEPKEISTRFSHPTISTPSILVENNAVSIELCQAKYYSYVVKRGNLGQNCIIYDGKWQQHIYDFPKDGVYTYSVIPYYLDKNVKHFGQEIILPTVNISSQNKNPQVKIPDISKRDWYNL